MNYTDFLNQLERDGFEFIGKALAFKELDNWVIGYIGLGGRFQQTGTKAFVLCARPKDFGFMDAPKKKYATKPMEYPYKLTPDSFNKKLEYNSELLRFDHGRVETEADWSSVYKILNNELPEALKKLSVAGLVKQLKKLKEPGYVEKIWLGEESA
ncbi:hypothetical protein K6Y31_16385 [Motilimonas cestriensis]|uniref:Uncharacterized protein n=1 Tax=Motilimonas cestriensis TaxID=2742685 RepID=A0ABS8WDN6_9GAMM|nr:hypothetical protein [Motilimonas cestriensis]MCE2596378.1 hypothetical protein [Motilimonas cestriensis]